MELMGKLEGPHPRPAKGLEVVVTDGVDAAGEVRGTDDLPDRGYGR